MELKELTEQVKALFNIEDIACLGKALMENIENEKSLDDFCKIVEGDLSKDWLQIIYQYYQADRKEKKQDYTPISLAKLMAKMVGSSDELIDMCAGTGALSIQYWCMNPTQTFELYELDENVIPYLLFNLVIRNIKAKVFRKDILSDETYGAWEIRKGNKYGKCIDIKSAI